MSSPHHTALDALAKLYAELTDGATVDTGALVLNSGDAGLLRSLDRLSAAEASAASEGGATIAAHAEHVRYGLSLMNRWASAGGTPSAGARWEEAWKITVVDEEQWAEIRAGLRDEAARWLPQLRAPREVTPSAVSAIIGSVVHVAYHLGAIRQIARAARGPREGVGG